MKWVEHGGSDQNSIRTDGGTGCIAPAVIHVNQDSSRMAFAISFCNLPASNIMAFSYHVRGDLTSAAKEHVQCAI
eukprot:1160449-Pelagomonas_calceolata.AAC.14